MSELNFPLREAVNEPIKDYKAGSKEKASLKKTLTELKSKVTDFYYFHQFNLSLICMQQNHINLHYSRSFIII